MKTLKLLYFARLRESFGRESEEMILPDEVSSVGLLVAYLANRGGRMGERIGK